MQNVLMPRQTLIFDRGTHQRQPWNFCLKRIEKKIEKINKLNFVIEYHFHDHFFKKHKIKHMIYKWKKTLWII
jgi:hypothetical protein